MSGETEKNVSGWTVDTALAHLTEMLRAQDQRHTEALRALRDELHTSVQLAKEAVAVAEINAEKWRDNANEWRGSMADREATFARADAVTAAHAALSDRMEAAAKLSEERLALLTASREALRTEMTDQAVRTYTTLDGRLRDLTAQVTANLGADAGSQQQRAEQRLDTSRLIAALGVGVTLIVVAISVVALIIHG